MKKVIEINWMGIFLSIGIAVLFPSTLAAQGSFTFNGTLPADGTLVADSVAIETKATSTYELQSITASVDGRSTNLTFTAGDNTWRATLSLAGLASGQKTLTLTATDVFNYSGQTQRTIIRDVPPAISIIEPRLKTVARPDFPLNITASDDFSGSIIRVYYGAALLATGTNSLVGSASISNLDGAIATINVTVTDSAGQSTNVSRDLYVFTATNWIESCRADGPILDVTSNSVLFATGAGLKTKSLVTGGETLLVQPAVEPDAGFFTSLGAVYQSGREVYDFRNGTLIDLGGADSSAIRARDDWSLWVNLGALYLRDEFAGTTTLITASNLNDYLGPKGQVGYIDGKLGAEWRVHNYSNQVDTQVASGSAYTYDPRYGYLTVQCEGSRFVCAKYDIPETIEHLRYIVSLEGTNETVLSTNLAGSYSFMINSGWVAFSATGPTGINQIWTLSPTNVREQRTFFGNSSVVRALAPNGELVVSSGGQLYLVRDGKPPQLLGAWNFGFTEDSGKILWQDGKWWWRLGRSLFQLSQVPTLSAAGNLPANSKIYINADPGAQIVIQWSSNLVDWVNFSTNNVSNAGTVDFADPSGFSPPGRFFRAFVPFP